MLEDKWSNKITFLESTVTVFDDLKKMANERAEEGTSVVAEIQTGGHGRLNRNWISPKGGLYFAFLIRPKKQPIGFSLVIALWIAEFLEKKVGVKCDILWPNDIFVNDKKLGGILLEGITGENSYISVGIGLNINTEIKDEGRNPEGINPISIFELTGKKYDLSEFFIDLIDYIQVEYYQFEKKSFDSYLQKITEYSLLKNKKIEVIDDVSFIGQVKNIGSNGELIVIDENGIERSVWVCKKIRIL